MVSGEDFPLNQSIEEWETLIFKHQYQSYQSLMNIDDDSTVLSNNRT